MLDPYRRGSDRQARLGFRSPPVAERSAWSLNEQLGQRCHAALQCPEDRTAGQPSQGPATTGGIGR